MKLINNLRKVLFIKYFLMLLILAIVKQNKLKKNENFHLMIYSEII